MWLPVQKNSSEVSANSVIFEERNFSDIFLIFPGWLLLKNLLIQIQVKDEEWGEFVDMNSGGTKYQSSMN